MMTPAFYEKDFFANMDSMVSEKEVLDKKACMEEFMFLGLRKIQGINKNEFFNEFQKKYDEVYGETHRTLIRKGLILEEGEYIRLSETGIDVSNYVMSEYLL